MTVALISGDTVLNLLGDESQTINHRVCERENLVMLRRRDHNEARERDAFKRTIIADASLNVHHPATLMTCNY